MKTIFSRLGKAFGWEGLLLLAHPERDDSAGRTAAGKKWRIRFRHRPQRPLVQHLWRRLRRHAAAEEGADVVDDNDGCVHVEELHVVVHHRALERSRKLGTQTSEFAAVEERRRRRVEDGQGEFRHFRLLIFVAPTLHRKFCFTKIPLRPGSQITFVHW